MPAVDVVTPAIAELIGNNTSRHVRRNLQNMFNTIIEMNPVGKTHRRTLIKQQLKRLLIEREGAIGWELDGHPLEAWRTPIPGVTAI